MTALGDQFAIVGLGFTLGKPGYSPRAWQAEAARLAIEDAGLKREDIDGAVYAMGGPRSGKAEWTDAYPRVLGLPVKLYYRVGRGGGWGTWGIATSLKFLELGICRYIIIAGVDDSLTRSREAKKRGEMGAPPSQRPAATWGEPLGELRAASMHSLIATRHMHEYGTTSRQFGAIAVAARQWACLNPLARMYGRPITIEDHQNSPEYVWPYHLLDMCQVSDGAIAFVITTADRARDCAKRPVSVMGFGFGDHMERLWWEKENYTRLAVQTAKESAFRIAGIELGDIDIAMLYDCFTAELLFQLEDYGWCQKGEGGPFVEEGHIAPGGDVPVNTHGGLLSAYWIGGDLGGIAEAVWQLRGEAGERQVKDAAVCLVTGHGGEILSPGMCSVHTSLVLGRR